jgi:Mrp family chromosome partitioning ATPase
MLRKHPKNKSAAHKKKKENQDIEIKERLGRMKNKILIMSGKGGVGKSSVAAYLAVALAKRGFKVGLMDIDLHGPSIPRILGLNGLLPTANTTQSIYSIKYLPNLEVISIETLMSGKDEATIWRGPLKGKIIKHFIANVDWNDLDFLIIDSPPGTGDEPLTVAQVISDAKALIVTTPQEISLADVRKSINFCRRVGIEILGLVENMSGLQCPFCGKLIDIFKQDGGRMTAEKENLKLLATLPLDPEIVSKGDEGDMSLMDNHEHPITQAFESMVKEIAQGYHSLSPPADVLSVLHARSF